MIERQVVLPTDSSLKILNEITNESKPISFRVNTARNENKIITSTPDKFENLNNLEKMIIINQENHHLKNFLNQIKQESKKKTKEKIGFNNTNKNNFKLMSSK